MGLPVFWSDDLTSDQVDLDGPEGRHATVVRRIAAGERIRITNGRGDVVEGPVMVVRKGGLTVAAERRWAVERPGPRLVVVQALPKGERAELAVEMLTEVGADEIVPWNAERSQVRLNPERAAKTLTRWRAWAFEASKQSRRAWFCEVGELASTGDVAARLDKAALAVVLHEEATRPLAGLTVPADGEVVVVVGPEGGLSPAELASFGAEPVKLGDTVLRTSTAGVAAAAVLLAGGRWVSDA
jgi:16S rRNA (uracil1498-N3)-methyltransferase